MRALVGGLMVDVIDRLHREYPTVDPAQEAFLDDARKRLEAEAD